LKKQKLIYGVGINDANYVVNQTANGVKVRCPFYIVWCDILRRCYSKNYHIKYPTYSNCTVCSEWFRFSTFKAWMEKQNWFKHEIDKDLLVKGNTHYSPHTCVFITHKTNSFIIEGTSRKGECMLGVCRVSNSNKYHAQCKNPFSNKKVHLGYFNSELLAHEKWKSYKHQLACELAEFETDPRAKEALITRYL